MWVGNFNEKTNDKKEINARDSKMEISRVKGCSGLRYMAEKGKCVYDVPWKSGLH